MLVQVSSGTETAKNLVFEQIIIHILLYWPHHLSLCPNLNKYEQLSNSTVWINVWMYTFMSRTVSHITQKHHGSKAILITLLRKLWESVTVDLAWPKYIITPQLFSLGSNMHIFVLLALSAANTAKPLHIYESITIALKTAEKSGVRQSVKIIGYSLTKKHQQYAFFRGHWKCFLTFF